MTLRSGARRALGVVLLAATLSGGALAQSAPAGRVETLTVPSKTYRAERRVWVYTPPGYAAGKGAAGDLLVVFDGREYVEDIALPQILDRLLSEGKAPPFVAVMIDNSSGAARLEDLANRAQFADFLAGELVPWARSRWAATRDPRRTVVTGSSAGGLAAVYAAFRHPEVFGNVLSQSGAFWRGNEASNDPPYEWLTGQIAGSPKKDIRFRLEVGALETRGALGGAAPSILEANRRLRDALRSKGYAVDYLEVRDGNHGPEWWRMRLAPALAAVGARMPARDSSR